MKKDTWFLGLLTMNFEKKADQLNFVNNLNISGCCKDPIPRTLRFKHTKIRQLHVKSAKLVRKKHLS
jgi:hypothetical protein